jgi:cell division protein ZipA
MESLRWILLGAGIFFVFIIYLLGRNRRPKPIGSNESESEELPEFSANNWNDVDDNVSDVHITAREPSDVYLDSDDDDDYDDMGEVDDMESDDDLSDGEQVFDENNDEQNQDNQAQDIIVLTVIARADEGLHGDKINSAALANNLKYGYMEIFHRMGENAKPVFSVANMVEPGSFDPDTIHELRTPGLTFFMQLPVYGGKASDALTDMLQCAYQISELLDADLCDKTRQLLTESAAEDLRALAKHYDSE